jgi:Flp pilus assembly protein TadD
MRAQEEGVMRKTLALFAMAALAAFSAAASDLPTQAAGPTLQDTLNRAEVLAARQVWDGAIDAYREAIAQSPNDPALRNRLGICYQHKGDAKAARAAYKKALDLRKDYPEAWNNLGTIDHARGKYKQAIAAYSQAIEAKPQDAVFHKNLARPGSRAAKSSARSRPGTRPSVSPRRSSRARQPGSRRPGAASPGSTTSTPSCSRPAARPRRPSSTW